LDFVIDTVTNSNAAHVHAAVAPRTIAVAMSGGVDSSTVAAMLQAEGHTLIGLTMQLWNQRRLAGREGMPEEVQGRCCSVDDVYDARRVAERLGIPYYLVNLQPVQQPSQVRPTIADSAADRRGADRDRPLCSQ
jgi:tRNA-specific 2-thiouridylase